MVADEPADLNRSIEAYPHSVRDTLTSFLARARDQDSNKAPSTGAQLSRFLNLQGVARDSERSKTPTGLVQPSVVGKSTCTPVEASTMDLSEKPERRIIASLQFLQHPVRAHLDNFGVSLLEVADVGLSSDALKEPDLLVDPSSAIHLYKLVKLPGREREVVQSLLAAHSACPIQMCIFEKYQPNSNFLTAMTPPIQNALNNIQQFLQEAQITVDIVFSESLAQTALGIRNFIDSRSNHLPNHLITPLLSEEVSRDHHWLMQCPHLQLCASQCILANISLASLRRKHFRLPPLSCHLFATVASDESPSVLNAWLTVEQAVSCPARSPIHLAERSRTSS